MSKRRLALFVTIAGAMAAMMATGMRHSYGIYLRPITTELGWGREVFGLAMAIQAVLMGAGTPFLGLISDKIGVASVLVVGATTYALGLFWVAHVTSPVELTLSLGVVIGLAASATSLNIMLGAVGKLVPPESRTLALGTVTAGASLGQVLVLPFGQALLVRLGWSNALMVLSGVVLMVVPISLVFFMAGRAVGAPGVVQTSLRQALGEARSHRGYHLLTAGYFVCGFHVAFVGVHLPAFVADKGMSATDGATALMLVGLFNIGGSFFWGQMGARFSIKHALSLLYFLRAVVFTLFFLAPSSPWAVYIFGAAIGFLWLGTVPLTSGLVGQIFGVQYLTMLIGFVYFSHQVGGFLGSWLGGYLYDTLGSYDLMWYGAIGLALFASAVHLPINDRTLVRQQPATEPA